MNLAEQIGRCVREGKTCAEIVAALGCGRSHVYGVVRKQGIRLVNKSREVRTTHISTVHERAYENNVIIVPASLVRAAGMAKGMQVQIEAREGEIVIRRVTV